MPHISVILPVWNRESWIASAIQSIVTQSYTDFELILVDDGSTDQTLAVIEQTLKQYSTSHISVQIHSLKKNQGVSKARNFGIEKGRGQWFAFLDSDDQWHPQKLQKQCDHLLMQKNAGSPFKVCFTEEIWIRNGKRVNPMKKHQKYEGWIFKPSLKLCLMASSSIMIHRDIFETCGVFDESLSVCEDYDLWLRIAASYPVTLVPEGLMTRYGGHSDQLSNRSWGNDRYRIKSLHKILRTLKLSESDRHAALATLTEKSNILIQGYLKRNKNEEARLLQEFVSEVLPFG